MATDVVEPSLSPRALAEAIVEAANVANIGLIVLAPKSARGVERLFVSAAAAEIGGYSPEEVRALPALAPLADEEHERAEAILRQLLDGTLSRGTFETVLAHKSGAHVPIELAFTAIEHDGRKLIVLFALDLSRRHAAERAHDRLQAHFQELIEAAPDGVGIIQDGHFVYVNSRAVRMFGFDTAAEVCNTPLDQLFDAADVAIMRSRIGAMLSSGAKHPPYAYTLIRRDGERSRVEITSIATEHGGRPAVMGFARDLTERTRVDAMLAQADRLVALGTLAAGVAHEINNPLTFMYLRVSALERWSSKLPEALRSELLTQLDDLRAGADRVTRIVQDLRTFSRSGGQSKGPTDLTSVFRFVDRITGGELRERAELVFDYADIPPIEGEQGRLEQVFLNLVLNAVQAMPETPSSGNRVTVRARTDGECVRVEVEDNGAGIPPEVVPRVFDPFFTTKPVGVGTGLGLAICHGIITQLGGEITVASELGKGTTFRVVLPVFKSPVPR